MEKVFRRKAAQYFYALIFLVPLAFCSLKVLASEVDSRFGASYLHGCTFQTTTISCIANDCWHIFTPTSSWSSNHPGCAPTVSWTGCVPSCQVLDCNPGSGVVEIGTIMVYNGETPVALYRVTSNNGVVETILIDDF